MKKSVVCVTGGIASGKTVVANYLAGFGFVIIDADVIARQVVKKNSKCLKKLVQEFGAIILDLDGELDRAVLKKIVFDSSEKLVKLNQLTHPVIEQEIALQLKQAKQSSVLLVIPLLVAKMIERYSIDRVLVVDVDFDMQLKRVLQRDSVNSSLAKKMINSQISRIARLELATDVLINNNTLDSLYSCCDVFATFINPASSQKPEIVLN